MQTHAALALYMDEHLMGLGTGVERYRQLRRVLQKFLNRDLVEIRQRDLADALSQWDGSTRNRYKSALTHFFKWCREREYTALRPELSSGKESSRDAVLSLDQLRTLYDVAPARGDWCGFLRLLILTGQRRMEVSQLDPHSVSGDRWEQVSTKNGVVPHTVFLGDRSQAIIAAENVWSDKTTFADMKRRWFTDAGMNPADWKLHDLRRSFATHLADAGHPVDIVDRHLNHVASASSRGVQRVYIRSQFLSERRDLAREWEDILFPKGLNKM